MFVTDSEQELEEMLKFQSLIGLCDVCDSQFERFLSEFRLVSIPNRAL